MKDIKGKILYIGKASSLRKRLKQYFLPGKDSRLTIPFLLSHLHTIDTLLVSSEKEALLLENTLIKKHKPKYNILLKDDKNYISLSIDLKDAWPKLHLIRYKTAPRDGTLHFGPYPSTTAARNTLELMRQLFPLRQCSNEEFKRRTRPCLLYDIKRCIAPCVHKCSKEEYKTFVDGAIQFLKGHNEEVKEKLTADITKAAENLEFERAASLLRTLKQLEYVTGSPSSLQSVPHKDMDVLTLYQEGEHLVLFCLFFKKGVLTGSQSFFFHEIEQTQEEILSSFLLQRYGKGSTAPEEILLPFPIAGQDALLSILHDVHEKKITLSTPLGKRKKELQLLAHKNAKAALAQSNQTQSHEKILAALQEQFLLSRYPQKIECYDTSHLSGSHPVAAMVAFCEGKEDKKHSRLYHVKEVLPGDDYGALRYVLSKRLLRAKEEGLFPDLLLIDGGKGQLNAALDVLKELDIIHIDVLSLVKDHARHDKGLTQEKVYLPGHIEPIALPLHSPLLFFLQVIRDRAHIKAIGFHKKVRAKKFIQSDLDKIPGIGPTKKRNLLKHFGSLKNLLQSSEEELKKVPGLLQKDIENIKKLLSSS